MKKLNVFVFAMAISVIAFGGAAAGKGKDAALRAFNAPKNGVWLDDIMTKSGKSEGMGVGKSVIGAPIILGGGVYRHGVGAAPGVALGVRVDGAAKQFAAVVGVNDASWAKVGKVTFDIWVDGKKQVSKGPFALGDEPQLIEADLSGAKTFFLAVSGDGAYMAVDWGGALVIMNEGAATQPEIISVSDDAPMEIAKTDVRVAGIHGPKIVGSTPGRPFLFRIPATGEKPYKFEAPGLPEGLKLDAERGIITGSLKKDGETKIKIKLIAKNGTAERELTIVGGAHKLALTPPMGWNSWNVWGTSVDAGKVRDAADAMENSGLASFGYRFVNIDDAWEGKRDETGVLRTNEKFPDMKQLTSYVHDKGLNIGLYSSPGPLTCGKYAASYQFEKIDAATWADWGFDYLKHDWCSYGSVAKDGSREELMKPYQIMRDALDATGRDIVFSLCQYGMGEVWKWGADESIGGNLWRTTGDIVDTWASMTGIGFSQNGLDPYAGPGHWNDPDMLVVGKVGWGPQIHPTRLTPNEQITHITLWSMLAAPLLIGCDMTALDEFTFNLLTNTEVIDVDQDALGRQARRVAEPGLLLEVWARPLSDGSTAVALFNRFMESSDVTVKWSDIGLSGAQPVRDLWKRVDLGKHDGSFTAKVPAHGAVLIKVGAGK